MRQHRFGRKYTCRPHRCTGYRGMGLPMISLVLEVELSEYGWLQAAVASASCCMAAEPLFLEDLGQRRAASEPEGLRAARHDMDSMRLQFLRGA